MYEIEHRIIRKGPLPLERNGYQWPASALGAYEMRILYNLRAATGKPITICLRMMVRAAEILLIPENLELAKLLIEVKKKNVGRI